MDRRFSQNHLVEDMSLFRGRMTIWHQERHSHEYISDGLRDLDTDATWGKSSHHSWVCGYVVHLTCNENAFPATVSMERLLCPRETFSMALIMRASHLNDK